MRTVLGRRRVVARRCAAERVCGSAGGSSRLPEGRRSDARGPSHEARSHDGFSSASNSKISAGTDTRSRAAADHSRDRATRILETDQHERPPDSICVYRRGHRAGICPERLVLTVGTLRGLSALLSKAAQLAARPRHRATTAFDSSVLYLRVRNVGPVNAVGNRDHTPDFCHLTRRCSALGSLLGLGLSGSRAARGPVHWRRSGSWIVGAWCQRRDRDQGWFPDCESDTRG